MLFWNKEKEIEQKERMTMIGKGPPDPIFHQTVVSGNSPNHIVLFGMRWGIN